MKTVVVMKDDAGCEESTSRRVYNDRNVVILGALVEKLRLHEDCDSFSIYDVSNSDSVQLLQQFFQQDDGLDVGPKPSFFNSFSSILPLQNIGYRDHVYFPHFIHFNVLRVSRIISSLLAPVSDNIADRSIYARRFAAGQILPEDFFGSLLGYMFVCPSSIEVMEALLLPQHRDQSSFAWQVHCPSEWVGKTYGELLLAWVQQNDPALHDCGSAVVVAVYRTHADGVDGYNLTMPELEMVLDKRDLLTTLGSAAFGRCMAGRCLLRGAEGA